MSVAVVSASAQVSNAVVTGIVADAQGGILPGVTITVTNAESGVVRTIVTEENGRYRLGGIPPGRYNLKAELPGFATQEEHTSELQSLAYLVCRLLLEKKKTQSSVEPRHLTGTPAQ